MASLRAQKQDAARSVPDAVRTCACWRTRFAPLTFMAGAARLLSYRHLRHWTRHVLHMFPSYTNTLYALMAQKCMVAASLQHHASGLSAVLAAVQRDGMCQQDSSPENDQHRESLDHRGGCECWSMQPSKPCACTSPCMASDRQPSSYSQAPEQDPVAQTRSSSADSSTPTHHHRSHTAKGTTHVDASCCIIRLIATYSTSCDSNQQRLEVRTDLICK